MTALLRWLALLLLALLALQLFFVLRIAAMTVVDPQSTAFQRSEAWRIQTEKDRLKWRQQWVGYGQISDHLKRAVIASEDDGFSNHDGVDWDALEKAWQKNAKAEARAAKNAAAAKTFSTTNTILIKPRPNTTSANRRPSSRPLRPRA